jgi:hypothetical protein
MKKTLKSFRDAISHETVITGSTINEEAIFNGSAAAANCRPSRVRPRRRMIFNGAECQHIYIRYLQEKLLEANHRPNERK